MAGDLGRLNPDVGFEGETAEWLREGESIEGDKKVTKDRWALISRQVFMKTSCSSRTMQTIFCWLPFQWI